MGMFFTSFALLNDYLQLVRQPFFLILFSLLTDFTRCLSLANAAWGGFIEFFLALGTAEAMNRERARDDLRRRQELETRMRLAPQVRSFFHFFTLLFLMDYLYHNNTRGRWTGRKKGPRDGRQHCPSLLGPQVILFLLVPFY